MEGSFKVMIAERKIFLRHCFSVSWHLFSSLFYYLNCRGCVSMPHSNSRSFPLRLRVFFLVSKVNTKAISEDVFLNKQKVM